MSLKGGVLLVSGQKARIVLLRSAFRGEWVGDYNENAGEWSFFSVNGLVADDLLILWHSLKILCLDLRLEVLIFLF